MTASGPLEQQELAVPGTSVPVLADEVRRRLAAGGLAPTADAVGRTLRDLGRVVGDGTVLAVCETLRRESVGAGPLDQLLDRPGVTDVLVNGCESVYVDDGAGLRRVGLRFSGEDAVRRLAVRLAAGAGRRLDDASPYVDVRLADGVRFHAVLAPIAGPGSCLSFRVPARSPIGLDGLRAGGTVDDDTAALLTRIVSCGLALLVSGGTGSGKTTVLAAMLGLMPPQLRLVIVEDASELRPIHPHVVRLEARTANAEGTGAVPVRELVRQALRMRPDRLVVGEVRGAEVVDLLAAVNTGHEGGCGTLHANSAAAVPARLEALAMAAGMARDAVHSQVAAGLDAVVHLERGGDGTRRVTEICALRADPDGRVRTVPALTRVHGRSEPGPGLEILESRCAATPPAREVGS